MSGDFPEPKTVPGDNDVTSEMSSATHDIFKTIQAEIEGSPKGFGSPAAASPLDHTSKQLDFGVPKTEHGTPSTPFAPSGSKPTAAPATEAESEMIDYNQFIKDTVMWTYKVRSAVYLLGGLAVIALAHRAFTSRTSLITGVCYALLAQLALNFGRYFISPKLQERCTWSDSAWTHYALQRITATLRALATLHDAHMMGADPLATIRIGALLWLVSLAGLVISATSLATAVWIAAFTLPKAYAAYKRQVDSLVAQALAAVQEHFSRLDRKLKAGVIVIPVLFAGYALSRADLAIASFLLLVYGRLWLKPAEVEAIHARAAPLTTTAAKVAGGVRSLVADAAVRYDLTPTPNKRKAKAA